ncbi:MAG TPA: DUF4255 domain-containing protein [Kofleriaceae bacterium]|nr:DUF4255 domain-containing protein [Kofleriaceae bacterium]
MSNHLAVAAVTATLRHNLQAVLDAEVSSFTARVATQRPNAPSTDLPSPGINIFLFQVTPNAALRNADLPTRRGDGRLVSRPAAALDLHYLLSFYGDDARLEPQILLGCAARALHAQPVLTRDAIQATLSLPMFDFVAESDLAHAIDLVRFTQTALSLEEMSKLWSVFLQSPYVLSMAYQAGVVLLERDLPVSAPLPVRVPPNVYTVQTRLPVITQILSRSAPLAPLVAGQPILPGYLVVLAGTELQGPTTVVRIDGVDTPATISDEQITIPLPATLRAGTHSVQVVHELAMGTPPVPHTVLLSNLAAFALQPTVTAAATASAVTLTVTPQVGKRQRVRLMLSPMPGIPGASYAFEAPSRDVPAAPDETATIVVPISGVAAGTYLVRVQVDGAQSPLGFDAGTGAYNSPTVAIP